MIHIFEICHKYLCITCTGGPVKLEHHGRELGNNTLISSTSIEEWPLVCSTDRTECCSDMTDECVPAGNWYMPNGSVITQPISTMNEHSLFQVTRENQTVTLSLNSPNSSALPIGIYHCELLDQNNSIHQLYVGIYQQEDGKS